MQKVLRRTHLAKGQARRKAEKEKQIKAINLHRYIKRQQKPLNAEHRDAVRAARKVQREDWTLGALAPKRDVGDDVHKYGTVSVRRLQPPVEKGEGWWKDYGIVEGDRVVIVEPGHRDRGKIGTVRDLKMEAESCVVQGLNEVDVAVPDYMLVNEQDKSPRRTVEAPLPLSSVNLVYPLPNPTTGELRDVIITQLTRGKIRDPKNPPARYIADYDPPFSVPYPEEEQAEYKDHDGDCLRIEVETRTWVPTLIRPPMPPSIIDELRNKYSKFRDRHDEDFILKKKAEDEAVEQRKKELKQLMRSPTQELFKRERNRKKKAGSKQKKKLDNDALSNIGQHMAKHRGLLVPEVIKASTGTTAGLASAMPSRATSSAIRSTLSIPPSASTTLIARPFHSNNRLSLPIVERIIKRGLSTMMPIIPGPSSTGVNTISVRGMTAPGFDQWTKLPFDNADSTLLKVKSETNARSLLHENSAGSVWTSESSVVRGEDRMDSKSLGPKPASSQVFTFRQVKRSPDLAAQEAKNSKKPLIRKFDRESTPVRKYASSPVKPILDSTRKSGHSSTEPTRAEELAHFSEAHIKHKLREHEELASPERGNLVRRIDNHLDLDDFTSVREAQALFVRRKQDLTVNFPTFVRTTSKLRLRKLLA